MRGVRIVCLVALAAVVSRSPPLQAQAPARYVVTAGAVVPLGPYRSEFGVDAEWRPAPWVTVRRDAPLRESLRLYLRLGAMVFGRVDLEGYGPYTERGPGFGLGVAAGLRHDVGQAADLFLGIAIDKFQVIEYAGDDVCQFVGPECLGNDAFDGQASPFGVELGLALRLPIHGWSVEVWDFGALGYRSYHPTIAQQLRIQLSRSFD